ncbi:hypothetical protein BMR02_16390 [Methylococcaceae bacterium HT1]|nr:hypothetical protein BMR02_16390 [Methylococcaceae bacterium HT1]
MKSEINTLPPLEKSAEWARKAAHEGKWSESAQRWAILRKAYSEQAMAWLQGANAHIEANELDQAEQLLNYGRQHFRLKSGKRSLSGVIIFSPW